MRKDLPRGWFTYILECRDNSLYTGITTDLDRRITEHNEGKLGARYTRARRPVKLVYFESLSDRSEASKREAEIKSLSRDQKIKLLKTFESEIKTFSKEFTK